MAKQPWARSAIALLALAAIVVATWAYFSMRAPQRKPNGQIATPGKVKVEALQVGDCLSLPLTSRTPPTRLTVVPCTTPHNGQVVAVLLAPDGPFPGPVQFAQSAYTDCLHAAQTYMGGPILAPLRLRAVTSGTATDWNDPADRTEVCVVWNHGGSFTGDVRHPA